MDPELERTRELIDAARAGEQAACEELFRLHRAELSRKLRGRVPAELRRRVEDSDVLQSALADAVRAFDTFEYQGRGSFRRWLARILENRLRMDFNFHVARERRSARREVRLAGPDATGASVGFSPAADITSPSQAAAASEQRAAIEGALAKLSEDHRHVIRLVRLEGRSLADAARELGRTENAAKKLLARALLELSSALRPGGEAP
jgi:RNA polymerase sigma-70 factor (ECF subfamily)